MERLNVRNQKDLDKAAREYENTHNDRKKYDFPNVKEIVTDIKRWLKTNKVVSAKENQPLSTE